MFITAGIINLCEQELKIVRAAKTCYAGRMRPAGHTLPIPDLYQYSATWHIGEFGILKSEANSPSPICECIGFPDMPSGFVWGEKLQNSPI